MANKVTANYIDAMDITARKITVLQNSTSANSPVLFEADGLSNSGKVTIAGFEVDYNSLHSISYPYPGSSSVGIMISNGTTSNGPIGSETDTHV